MLTGGCWLLHAVRRVLDARCRLISNAADSWLMRAVVVVFGQKICWSVLECAEMLREVFKILSLFLPYLPLLCPVCLASIAFIDIARLAYLVFHAAHGYTAATCKPPYILQAYAFRQLLCSAVLSP
jgi:hypothetical protein